MNVTNDKLPAVGLITTAFLVLYLSSSRANPWDFTRWAQSTAPTTNSLYKVAYGHSTFVAVGSGGTIVSTASGAWQRWDSHTTNTLWDVTHAADIFVAVGEAGTVVTSFDGSNWVLRLSTPQLRFSHVTYGNGLFLALAGYQVATSRNGIDWIWGPIVRTNIVNGTLFGVAFGSGAFFGVRGDFFVGSEIYRSTDGFNWTMVENYPSSVSLFGIRYVAGLLIAHGNNGFVSISSNGGQTWDLDIAVPTCPSCRSIQDVGYGEGQFLLTANRTFWASFLRPPCLWPPTRVYWGWQSFDPPCYPFGLVYGGGKFVAVGLDGCILETRSSLVRPRVAIATGTTNAVVTWSDTNGFVLEASDQLSAPAWLPLACAPNEDGAVIRFTNSIDSRSRFYRLRSVWP